MCPGKEKRTTREQLFGDSPCCPPKDALLLLYCRIDVKRLRDLGKGYPWPKPQRCPTCEGLRLWGHGYSARYFEGFMEPLWVKRYRCPDCHAVHTCRPEQYFERYRYPVVDVLMSLLNKIMRGRWLRCINRQNQLSWYRSAWAWCSLHQAIATLTVEHLRQYVAGRIPRSFQCAPLRM